MSARSDLGTLQIEFVGEMMPWVQDYWGYCVNVRITDPTHGEALGMMMPKSSGDNFMPYRNGVAHVRPPQGELSDYWAKKVKSLNGKQVRLVAKARRFDGECMDTGPEHGWALEMISAKIVKKKWTASDRKDAGQAKRGPQRGR